MTEFSFYTDGNPQDPEQVARAQALRQQQAAMPPQPQNQLQLQQMPGDPYQSRVQKYSFLIFLTLFFLIPAGVFGLLYVRNKDVITEELQEAPQGDVAGVADENIGPASTPINVEGKLFYIHSNNVYVSDVQGKNEETLSSFGKNVGDLHSLELIDEDHLGLFTCDRQTQNPSCEILQIVISTKEVSTIQKLDPAILLYEVAWADKDTYVYAVQEADSPHDTLYLRTQLQDIEIASFERSVSNRDPFIEDDRKLSVSPDNTKLFYINTSGKLGFDFTVYVYDLSGIPIDQIDNATMPDWYDDNTIVYRGYSNQTPGYVYMRDVQSRASTKLDTTHLAAYGPKVYNNEILYWVPSGLGMVYHYDVVKNILEPIGINTAYPIWVSDHEVMYTETRKCRANECSFGSVAFETQFMPASIYVLDMNTGIETKVDMDVDMFEGGIVTWYNRQQ